MRIGIVLYSKTGHTQTVVNTLEEALKKSGHDVDVLQIKAENDEKDPLHQSLLEKPKIDAYDLLIVGSPVQGFNLAVPTQMYLQLMDDLAGKKFICFVTEALPFKWMGGEQACKKMKQILTEKGGKFIGHSVINWHNSDRNDRIDKMIKHMLSLIEIDVAVDL